LEVFTHICPGNQVLTHDTTPYTIRQAKEVTPKTLSSGISWLVMTPAFLPIWRKPWKSARRREGILWVRIVES